MAGQYDNLRTAILIVLVLLVLWLLYTPYQHNIKKSAVAVAPPSAVLVTPVVAGTTAKEASASPSAPAASGNPAGASAVVVVTPVNAAGVPVPAESKTVAVEHLSAGTFLNFQ